MATLPSRTANSSGVIPPSAFGSARWRMMPVPDAPPARAGTYSPFGHGDRRPGVDVRAACGEQFDDVRMVFGDGPHQRRLRADRVSGVDVGAPVEQQRDGLGIAGTRAAVMSAVSPPGVAVFGSAPASSSVRMIAALPLRAARPIGVTPYRVAAFTSAPRSINASTAFRSFWRTAW